VTYVLGNFTPMKTELSEVEKKYLGKLVDRIVGLRKERNMSQEKLANESEIARSLMRGYERKERNISFGNLIRIIKFGFNMTIEDFFSEGFDIGYSKAKDSFKTEQPALQVAAESQPPQYGKKVRRKKK
jgi:transcriptional regulator with XRE-family HTH domain